MNFNTHYISEEYKPCAGRGCQKRGVHVLKIVFLNKLGWFCDSCKSSLIAEDLVVEVNKFEEVGA